MTANVLQLYLVADFEKQNFKFRTNENRRTKLERTTEAAIEYSCCYALARI
jgi:hypothetical protein